MKNTLLRLVLVIFASLPLFAFAATEAAKDAAPPAQTQPAAVEPGIDLNSADAAVLQTLNGIGPAKAKAIVEYRKAHGPFAAVDELLEVKGIGPAILEKNRSKLRVH